MLKSHCSTKIFLCVLVIWLSACGGDSTTLQSSVPSASTQTVLPDNVNKSAESKKIDSAILYFDDVYTNDEILKYGSFQVEKRSKTLWMKDAEVNADVNYVVLKHNGKTAANFEGIHYPLGNDSRFGLFPVLGRETKQLIIEQTAPRE